MNRYAVPALVIVDAGSEMEAAEIAATFGSEATRGAELSGSPVVKVVRSGEATLLEDE